MTACRVALATAIAALADAVETLERDRGFESAFLHRRVMCELDWKAPKRARMTAWLDENCGADGWAMTPSGMRGVLNDAVSIYFPDAALAGAFVARWCIGYYKVAQGPSIAIRSLASAINRPS